MSMSKPSRPIKKPIQLTENPKSLKAHIKHFPEDLVNAIMSATNKGVLRQILKWAFATPSGVKANCYAFFLALPDIQWQDRRNKTQPGDNCAATWSRAPLNFAERGMAANQLIKRVLCDNTDVVHFIKPLRGGYPRYIIEIKLPKGYILGCCIVGANDYHFCRREGIDEILNNKAFKQIWEKKNIHGVRDQLLELQKNGHTYCWSHVAGWSGRLKLVDADGTVIINPVDRNASGNAVRRIEDNRCNHNYNGLYYDTFVGFFILKARSTKVKDDNKIPRNESMANKALEGMGISKNTFNHSSNNKTTVRDTRMKQVRTILRRPYAWYRTIMRPRIQQFLFTKKTNIPGFVTSHLHLKR